MQIMKYTHALHNYKNINNHHDIFKNDAIIIIIILFKILACTEGLINNSYTNTNRLATNNRSPQLQQQTLFVTSPTSNIVRRK